MDTKDADGNLVKGGICFDSRTFVLTSCALSIFMDVIIIPIPSIMVWNLHMERKTKILVVIVMSLGYVIPCSNTTSMLTW
jgi:structural maintenance of chromosome 2